MRKRLLLKCCRGGRAFSLFINEKENKTAYCGDKQNDFPCKTENAFDVDIVDYPRGFGEDCTNEINKAIFLPDTDCEKEHGEERK